MRAAASCLSGSALAVLAALVSPLFQADGGNKDIDPTIPEVEVTGGARRGVQAPVASSSSQFSAPLLDIPKAVTVRPRK